MSEVLAFDTKRHKDVNGYLHVEVSPLTKETVNPYYGREIPGWEDLELDPEKIYYGYRAGRELKKALETFNGIPVLDEHKLDSAEKPLKDERVGYTGTSAAWEAPYIMNALIITDATAIELIETDKQRELSASYRYKPVFETGYFNGEKYDFIMTEIQANHIALVAEGRAGSDVLVYDNNSIKGEGYMAKNVEELKQTLNAFVSAFQKFLDEEKTEDAHASDSEYKEAMDKAGCDSENEAEQKAFAEGVKYGEELMRNPDERKKLDLEHESEGEKKALGEDENNYKEVMDKAGCDSESEAEQKAFAEGVKYAENLETKKTNDKEMEKKDEAASDKMISKAAFDEALKQAEIRGAAIATKHIKELYDAASKVKRTVSVNPLAYDSAADIYKAALRKEGADIMGVDKSAYASLYNSIMKNKSNAGVNIAAAYDAKTDEDNYFAKIKKI